MYYSDFKLCTIYFISTYLSYLSYSLLSEELGNTRKYFSFAKEKCTFYQNKLQINCQCYSSQIKLIFFQINFQVTLDKWLFLKFCKYNLKKIVCCWNIISVINNTHFLKMNYKSISMLFIRNKRIFFHSTFSNSLLTNVFCKKSNSITISKILIIRVLLCWN